MRVGRGPPGHVVESLLHANLLETRGEYGAHVRFTFESVQDYFIAENQITEIENNPVSAADAFFELPFTTVEVRLDRIGRRLRCCPTREQFLSRLAERDFWKAAIVLRGDPHAYCTVIRGEIIASLCRELSSRFTCRRAKAAELLGLLDCDETREQFPSFVPPSSNCSDKLRTVVALAATRLSVCECVEHVFNCWWFRHVGFFESVRAYLAAASDTFRTALADFAADRLTSQRGSDEHCRAVQILAYLRDIRLLEELESLIESPVQPKWYEITALFNFNCERSAAIYEELFKAAAVEHSLRKGIAGEKLDDLWIGVTGMELGGTIRSLSPHVEKRIVKFLCSPDRSQKFLARTVSRSFPSIPLTEAALPSIGYIEAATGHFALSVRGILTFDAWKSLWDKFTDIDVRRNLVTMSTGIRDPRMEIMLLSLVEDKQLGVDAIRTLEQSRCLRAARTANAN